MKKLQRKSLTLNDVVLGNIRRHGRQNLVLLLGVLLAVYFLSASLFGASSLLASMRKASERTYGRTEQVLWNVDDRLKEEIVSEHIFSEMVQEDVLYISDMFGKGTDEVFSIARYTPQVDELQCWHLLDGRFPEKEGEIALESGILLKLRQGTSLGEEITLELTCFDGEKAMDQKVEKTFTLVGILDKKGPKNYSWMHGDWSREWEKSVFTTEPQAVVSMAEPVVPGAREMPLLLGVWSGLTSHEKLVSLVENWEERTGDSLIYDVPYGGRGMVMGADFFQDDNGAVLVLIAGLFLALSIAAMTGIANALSSNIEKRKRQIGLLRAIGATQRQIRRILVRETIYIMVCTLPLGMLLAIGTFVLMRNALGSEYFVVSVPVWMVAIDLIACALCIYIASLAPVRRTSQITPMQAVRDIDLARMFLRKGDKSRKEYVPQKLIAHRNALMRRGRSIGTGVLFTAGAVLFSLLVMLSIYVAQPLYATDTGDITVEENRWDFIEMGNYDVYLNEDMSSNVIPYSDYVEMLQVPGVRKVQASCKRTVNIFMDSISDYVTIGHFGDLAGYASPESSGYDRAWDVARGEETQDATSIEMYEDYLATKQRFGVEREILSTYIYGFGREQLETLQDCVIAGKMDIDKVLSGEEVLIVAPEQIAIAYFASKDLSAMSGVIMDSGERTPSAEQLDKIAKDTRKEVAFSGYFHNDAFHPGDVLECEIWTSSESREPEDDGYSWPDDLKRMKKTWKIGAILSAEAGFPHCSVITGDGIFADLGVSDIGIWLESELDDALKEQITGEIEQIAGRSGSNFSDWRRYQEENRQLAQMIAIIGVVVCALSLAFTWAMLNNTVAGRIKSDMRQIGLLRAVGASKRVVLRSYMNQFTGIFAIGSTLSIVLVLAANYAMFNGYNNYIRAYLPLVVVTPAYCLLVMLLCLLSVKVKLRPIFKQSVVDNIRIL